MVGIVVVSHSLDLARAAVGLALQMVNGRAPRIEIAAGTSDDRLGTDAAAVAEAVVAADDGEGVVVIMDLGSAVLSAELALELLSKPGGQVRLVPAAFVEGIFAAVISAAGGGQLDAVARDAEEALDAKAAQLGRTEPPTGANVIITRPAIVAKATIVNPDGIHARPAALIVEALASLDAQVTIATKQAAPVSARSPTALMSLGTRAGDVLRIEADGAGADTAVDRIVALVHDGFGELAGFDRPSPEEPGLETLREQPIGVSPGRVVGPALRMPDPITEPDRAIQISEAERAGAIKRLGNVAADVAEQLRSRSTAAGTVGQLLEATATMATDPDLIDDASTRIRERGLTPERAIWEAIGSVADTIRGVGLRQAERVSDLYDIRNRMISSLTGRAVPGVPDPGHPFVLLAVDLAPADAAELDATRCLAIVTEQGGPTSHTAIIARSLGIPAVAAARGATAIPDGTLLLVDGGTGEVIKEPTADQQASATTVSQPQREKLTNPGSTADGHRIALLANIGSTQDVTVALKCGAEGVGLYRTELCFLGRTEAPSVTEQIDVYRAVFSKLGGRRVVVRTLDAGSDKPMPFLSHAAEPNPALGVRGFRTAASHAEILHDQLKAIKEAAAAESAEIWVMAPMITTVDEARTFAEASRAVGLPIIGVMIETPAAALQAELILAQVDFASIGTNDLAQYAFAADRQSTSLAALNDPWQPALLRLIETVTTAASRSGKPVGVCGEAAADPLLALVLTGLGVSSLSMAPGALVDVGRSLAAVTLEVCRQAARAACDSDSPDSARDAVRGIVNR
jgi:multiphosphoryl transfer protein